MNETYLAITMSDGSVNHYAFQKLGRNFAGAGGGWREVGPHAPGLFMRTDSDQNIEFDLRKTEREQWNVERRHNDGTVTPALHIVSWRRLSDAEHAMFERDRDYRGALVDNAGRIEHDMTKARDRHREKVRHARAAAMPVLDADFMRALGQAKKAEQDAVEAKRQAWRDAPADPRIDAAQSVEELKAIPLPR